jgi:hypothetical protein
MKTSTILPTCSNFLETGEFRSNLKSDLFLDSLLGAKFSTSDRDNDGTEQRNCASESESGWWFNEMDFKIKMIFSKKKITTIKSSYNLLIDCASNKVNLNGMYHGSSSMPVQYDVKSGKPIQRTPNDGIFWRNSK